MDKKLITRRLFLNFSKAFGTVNQDIFLSKLYHYGVRGTPPKWLENYLHNRTQFVKIGNTKSSCETITCGIQQRSTLGPLLFLLSGADEWEHATPILSLCHGLFAAWSNFSIPFLLWKKGSSGSVTSISFLWLVMALLRESQSREIRSKNKLVYENAVTGI